MIDTQGLAVHARAAGSPLLLMPYPRAVLVVVGDAEMDRRLDRLAGLGQRAGERGSRSSGHLGAAARREGGGAAARPGVMTTDDSQGAVL